MPLEKAKVGTPGFGRNIATEEKAGKPPAQAAAIAYSKARGDADEPKALAEAFLRGVAREHPGQYDAFKRALGPNTKVTNAQVTSAAKAAGISAGPLLSSTIFRNADGKRVDAVSDPDVLRRKIAERERSLGSGSPADQNRWRAEIKQMKEKLKRSGAPLSGSERKADSTPPTLDAALQRADAPGMIGSDARELGHHAYRVGKKIDANPFRDNTPEAKDFDKGWKEEHSKQSEAAGQDYRAAKNNRSYSMRKDSTPPTLDAALAKADALFGRADAVAADTDWGKEWNKGFAAAKNPSAKSKAESEARLAPLRKLVEEMAAKKDSSAADSERSITEEEARRLNQQRTGAAWSTGGGGAPVRWWTTAKVDSDCAQADAIRVTKIGRIEVVTDRHSTYVKTPFGIISADDHEDGIKEAKAYIAKHSHSDRAAVDASSPRSYENIAFRIKTYERKMKESSGQAEKEEAEKELSKARSEMRAYLSSQKDSDRAAADSTLPSSAFLKPSTRQYRVKRPARDGVLEYDPALLAQAAADAYADGEDDLGREAEVLAGRADAGEPGKTYRVRYVNSSDKTAFLEVKAENMVAAKRKAERQLGSELYSIHSVSLAE